MDVTATTPIELVEGVYATLASRVALGRERLGRPLTLAEKIISGLGLDGSLPEIFQPRASCADAAVKLLGLPYEFWSLALFVLLGVLALRLLRR